MLESRILHIHSGDCSAEAARAAGIPGDHVAFRDALIEGPPSPQLRPEYLARQWGPPPDDYEREISTLQQVLNDRDDPVVLWFDRDLFCRVNLWFVLTRVRPARETFLSDSHSADKQRQFADRRRLTTADVSAGIEAWDAYSSDDPLRVEQIAGSPSQFAAPLRLHLSRFPSVRNGLGVIENRVLDLVSSGNTKAVDLIGAFIAASEDLSLGDAQIWGAVRRLSMARTPLLATTSDDMRTGSVKITPAGEGVLSGLADAVKLNGIDAWLGGVHLQGAEARWRWNGEYLVRSDE